MINELLLAFILEMTITLSNKSDKYVDEYMLKEYGMKPALVDVTYMS